MNTKNKFNTLGWNMRINRDTLIDKTRVARTNKIDCDTTSIGTIGSVPSNAKYDDTIDTGITTSSNSPKTNNNGSIPTIVGSVPYNPNQSTITSNPNQSMTGSQHITNGGSTGSFTHPVTGNYVPSAITPSGLSGITMQTQSKVKTSVKYVIVKKDYSCLELEEDKSITPREMIGLFKFMSLVSMFMLKTSMKVDWEELIKCHNLQRHFVESNLKDVDYNLHTEVQYIFLYSK